MRALAENWGVSILLFISPSVLVDFAEDLWVIWRSGERTLRCFLPGLCVLVILLNFASIKPNWTLKPELYVDFISAYHAPTKDPYSIHKS